MEKITCNTCKHDSYTASPKFVKECPHCGAPFYIDVLSTRHADKGLSSILTLISKLRRIQPK